MTERWHARTIDEALETLQVEPERGLDREEEERRLREHGPNRLRKVETRPWWKVLLAQFRSIVVHLLTGAALLAFVSQRWPEGIAVVAVIVINAAIGFVTEWRAVRSMAALRERGERVCRVRREGREQEVDAPELVPGDIVLLQADEVVPADLRLVEAEYLRVDEAALTGESVPAEKLVDPVDEHAELAERRSMIYKGTSVADGKAVGVVVATGSGTELGRIAELAERAEAAATPLQQRLDRLGRRLAWLTIGIATVVAVTGLLLRHQPAELVVETALALGVAAIPEGLPIVATMALARGMLLMARRNALINRLTAVETLGATRVIFSDKTGTLTENRMRLQRVVTPAADHVVRDDRVEEEPVEDPLLRRVMEVSALCNTATLEGDEPGDGPRGDPTELALLTGGLALGVERGALLHDEPQVRIEPFDPRVKMMATVHELGGTFHVAVKGAPGAVMEVCTRVAASRPDEEPRPLDADVRERWLRRARALAGEGLRVLAVADKRVGSPDAEPYEDLVLLGLVGLLDPPRQGVKAAIDRCQAAGIRVAMVTGDQPETAWAIAHAVGIVGDPEDPEAVVMRGGELCGPDASDDEGRGRILRANIFARVSPEQKLELVRMYQEHGEVVAMTGDGVNDAPALKKADIGVAMGRRGTEAAKQAADMVLGDDAFETIVAAVEQGRVIFANIRKSVMFMLCTNVAEVLAVSIATFAGWTLPLRPLQILYLNVLTDVFPALALGVGSGSGDEMEQPPRDPQESVLTRSCWLEIGGWAALLGACVLGGLLMAEHVLELPVAEAVTISFLTLGFGKLWFTFNLRSPGSGLVRNEITRNRWVWAAIALCTVLLTAAIAVPALSRTLGTESPGPDGWLLLLGTSLVPLVVGQAIREGQRAHGQRAHGKLRHGCAHLPAHHGRQELTATRRART
ncbi:cation-translocating P-type ATPase [Paraliomyxa miuraensis]|uniref:cation-translocating P-type ATPase n=1 Tax=Paraliomyxa miuraensis TaxID=376150 RepID=UPI0022550457|nr:cation-transporting P-type ATPase [Paraliomyxa miuraensis]MCX4240305.1 cation-transporting P-type ATPase [Paraliomyxa miuraensis]